MPAKGPTLNSGDVLRTGDYLQSPNGFFFAVLQGDGNFCIYKGAPGQHFGWGSVQAAKYPPKNGSYYVVMQGDGNLCCYEDSAGQSRFVWGSVQLGGYAPANGNYAASIQDDANFCVYKVGVPGAVWCTMSDDPVVSIKDITRLEYDVAAATILKESAAELYRETVTNNSPINQVSTIAGSASVTETQGWSDALAQNVIVSTSFKVGIPFLASGSVNVSIGVTHTFTRNQSTADQKTWSFNTPVTVPPNTTMVGLVAATISTIAVPYTLSGTLVLRSGIELQGSTNGVYVGSNSHDLTVTFIQQQAGAIQLLASEKVMDAHLK